MENTSALSTHPHSNTRRQIVASALACAAISASPAHANTSAARAARPVPKLADKSWQLNQIVDTSARQQDVSKDFLIGVRTAITEVNQSGGVKGLQISHQVIETDGGAANVNEAVRQAHTDARCNGLIGSVSDSVANIVNQRLSDGLALPQCAPWLMTAGGTTRMSFDVFSSRAQQLRHAVGALNVMNLRELWVVYGSLADEAANQAQLDELTRGTGMRVKAVAATSDWRSLGKRLNREDWALMLFVGGTPELLGFITALGNQSRLRFIVGLAEINLQTLSSVGVPKGIHVVATQVVPQVSSGMLLVRQYRSALDKYFDEPANAQSLSGYVAGRTAIELLRHADPKHGRESLQEAMARHDGFNLSGLTLSRLGNQRQLSFVTQTMLGNGSRIVG